ncbi:MAG: bifunctional diaminohydroxyphosphoribosylaminopyrimidine deaminase/5-amino-6-(5-phosphoribosylamino)uracil reductase RibD [Candidatus Micrarchaeota archaeon]
MDCKKDACFMQKALELAVKGRPFPNPYVGCVIVKEGKVIGEGWHEKAGKAHAEINAIENVKKKFGKKAGEMLANSVMYVNLEPCNHKGRTGPCSDEIIKNKIKKIVIGMKDENEKVKGGGTDELRKKGVEVEIGILGEKARALNAAYLKHVKTGMPLITLKMAMSLDGRTATKTGDSKWISGKKAREIVHKMRGKVGAVMVGIGTILADNPHLTCRVEGGKDPLRVIVDGNLRIPHDANVLFDKNVVIACMKDADKEKKKMLEGRKIKLIECPSKSDVKFDLKYLFKQLGKMGINHVMCEGGAELAAELIKEELVDEIILFVAPKIIGGERAGIFGGMGVLEIGDAKKAEIVRHEMIEDDLMIVAKAGWKVRGAAKGLYGAIGMLSLG